MISMINLEIVTDALEFAFNASESKWVCDQKITPAIAICEAALAEQSEPVARVMYDDDGIKTNNLIDCDLPVGTLLFTHPASKPLESDKDLIQALTERDEYHDMADKLAEGIALHFDGDIGEHSSSNSPWDRALDLLDSAACAETMRLTNPASKPSEPKPYCCYCESDNEGIRSTYFDQTCEGCVKRMTHPAPRPEPVATVQRINGITIGYLDVMQPVGTKLYTHTEPKPEPLRDDEVGDIARGMNIEITQDNEDTLLDFARAVEAAVWEKLA